MKNHDKITQVFHNGQPLPACPSADPNGCYTSIAYDKWTKVWTVQAQAPLERPLGLVSGRVDPDTPVRGRPRRPSTPCIHCSGHRGGELHESKMG